MLYLAALFGIVFLMGTVMLFWAFRNENAKVKNRATVIMIAGGIMAAILGITWMVMHVDIVLR